MQEILELLDAVQATKQAVIYCQGHQKGDTTAWGNRKADKEAKQAALTRGPDPTSPMASLFPFPLSEWDPQCTPQEQPWFKTEKGNFLPDGIVGVL
jgi:hypothetical protein